MIKVKFLKGHPEFGYFPGQEGELTQENAEKLLKSGHIELLEEDPENTLPAELPGRELLFENGFTTEKAKEATIEDLVKINGIGEATAKQIIEFFKED